MRFSCGAVVLVSSTPPVCEMIRDGENGLLANFFDTDEMADKAIKVLRDPAAYRPLGRAAEEGIIRDYSLEAVLPRMLAMYEEAVNKRAAMPKVVKKGPRKDARQPKAVESSGAGQSGAIAVSWMSEAERRFGYLIVPMFDEPEDDPSSVPATRRSARKNPTSSACTRNWPPFFEGNRKFDAEILSRLDAEVAREVQRTMARLEKSKSADSPDRAGAIAADAADLLNFPRTRDLSTNNYHIHRRPAKRWSSGGSRAIRLIVLRADSSPL